MSRRPNVWFKEYLELLLRLRTHLASRMIWCPGFLRSESRMPGSLLGLVIVLIGVPTKVVPLRIDEMYSEQDRVFVGAEVIV